MKIKSRSRGSKKEIRTSKTKTKKDKLTTKRVGVRFNKKTLKHVSEFLDDPSEEEKFKPTEFEGIVDPKFFEPSDKSTNPSRVSETFSNLIKPLDPSDEQALIELTGTGNVDSDVKIKTLSDMIEEALSKKRQMMEKHLTGYKGSKNGPPTAEDRIVSLYRQMGPVLAKYRSGLGAPLTRPDNWSAAIMFQATRVFASNMNDRLVQKFYLDVLLPRIRDDIAEYKRLNYHLFMSVRKAMFKPGAFFKGLILPLVESNSCTLREAVILGAIIEKSSIPMLHVAVALYIMCNGENSGALISTDAKVLIEQFSGARSVFIRVLLQKRCGLPFKVVNAIYDHFIRFAFLSVSEEKQAFRMPVIFHQSLLCFVNNYIKDLDAEQVKMLDELAKGNCNLVPHASISAEIRRIVGEQN